MKKLEYVPRCYGLSWNTETNSLLFRIEKIVLPQLISMLTSPNLLLPWLFELHPVPHSFQNIGQTGLPFGFEDQFVYDHEDENEFVYRFDYPPLVIETGHRCPTCQGEGTRFFSDNKCNSCDGEGIERIDNPDDHFKSGILTYYALVDALAGIIMYYYNDVVELPVSKREQIIELNIAAAVSFGKAFVWGWVNDCVASWVKDAPDGSEEPILNAMKSAKYKLELKKDNYDFRVLAFEDGRIGIEVPGNACDVSNYPERSAGIHDSGKTLDCHNVDSRVQQSYFIVGFAKLHDLVEAWILNK